VSIRMTEKREPFAASIAVPGRACNPKTMQASHAVRTGAPC
jgi:hypothetical protein